MQTLILIHVENVGLEEEDTEFDPGATRLLPDDAPTYTATPLTFDLVLVEVGATRERPLREHITGDGILEIKVSLSGDEGFSISVSGTVNLGDGHVHWITIQCSSTAEGAADTSLALTSDDGDVEVGLVGRFGSAPLAFEPLNLGQNERGKSTTAVVRLTNPGPGPMPFPDASNPDAPLIIAIHGQLMGGGIEAGESSGLLVAFVPPTVGKFTSDIVITWQDGQSGTTSSRRQRYRASAGF